MKLNILNDLLLEESNRKKYDPTDEDSIVAYAKALLGMSFEDILRNNGLNESDIEYVSKKSMTNKGLLGVLIEEAWFGYPANSRQEADFIETGIELKSTPYEGEGEKIRPGETISITQIDYSVPQEQNFKKSHVYKKIQKILLVYYHRIKELAQKRCSKLIYRIDYVFRLQPDDTDMAIISADYRYINGMIMQGRADKLSRSHGQYLGVAPKSRKKEYVVQYYGSHKPALKRAYVLKIAYLKSVLRHEARLNEDNVGKVIHDVSVLNTRTLAEVLVERLNRYIDMDVKEIWEQVRYAEDEKEVTDKTKNKDAVLSCRMLGVKSNRVEEFIKAGIIPKIIVFRKDKKDNQQFRIEDFKFNELMAEEDDTDDSTEEVEEDVAVENDSSEDDFSVERHGWEASKLFSYLADRQYLLLVFWETDRGKIFKGSQLWGIPEQDLDIVHNAWIKTRKALTNGVKLSVKEQRNGTIKVYNNLPGIKDNGIFHIRPHADNAFYIIDGKQYGAGKKSDSDILPNGDRMTKQAYWLNRVYIESQLKPELVKRYN